LDDYRAKRDAGRTPEPVPGPGDPVVDHTGDVQEGRGATFVVQEHHATDGRTDFGALQARMSASRGRRCCDPPRFSC